MKQSRLQTYHLRSREVKKDSEGGTNTEYAIAVKFSGEVWPADGRVQAEIYGEKLTYVRNVRIDGTYVITTDRSGIVHYVYSNGLDIVESDGMCLYVDATAEPDYKVLSIKPYQPLRLECIKL
jgi:hypothetical protein